MSDSYYILTTNLLDCLSRVQEEGVFRTVRYKYQPGSGAFLDSVLVHGPDSPNVHLVFFNRVHGTDGFRCLMGTYDLAAVEPDPEAEAGREGYLLRLSPTLTFETPKPFWTGTALWALVEATRNLRAGDYFSNPRVLIPIDAADHQAILDFAPAETPDLATPLVLEDLGLPSPTERLLEDFLVEHLDQIEEGLVPYDENRVRQCPTGDGGFIDLFCRDANGRPVVVELKKGKEREAVIGQLCRYMGWVMESQDPGSVRGIVVANAIDQRLRFAARAVPNVKLVEYGIHFTFRPLETS